MDRGCDARPLWEGIDYGINGIKNLYIYRFREF